MALRYDRLDTELTELRLDTPICGSDDAFLPMAGLVFSPRRRSAVRQLSKSFEPQAVTAFDENGDKPFDPEEGAAVEVGSRPAPDGRTEASVAFFDTSRQRARHLTSGASEQNGQEQSRGFEFDLRFQPRANVQTIVATPTTRQGHQGPRSAPRGSAAHQLVQARVQRLGAL